MLVAWDVRCLFRGSFGNVGSMPFAAAELEDGRVDWWTRCEGISRQRNTRLGLEAAQVAATLIDDAAYHGSLQHEVCGGGLRCSRHKCEYCGGDRVGRVGYEAEGSSWWDEILQVALNDAPGAAGEFGP